MQSLYTLRLITRQEYRSTATLCPVSYYKAGISQCSHFVSCVVLQGRNIPVQSLCALCLITRQEYRSTATLCPVSYYKAGISQYSHFVPCVLLQGRNTLKQSLCVLCLFTRHEYSNTNCEHLHFILPHGTVTLTATTLISCLPLDCNPLTQSWSHTTSRFLTKNTDKTYFCQLFTISGFWHSDRVIQLRFDQLFGTPLQAFDPAVEPYNTTVSGNKQWKTSLISCFPHHFRSGSHTTPLCPPKDKTTTTTHTPKRHTHTYTHTPTQS